MGDTRSASVPGIAMSGSGATPHVAPVEETLRSASLPGPCDLPPHPQHSRSTSTSSNIQGESRSHPNGARDSKHKVFSSDHGHSMVSLRSLQGIPNIVVNDTGSRPSSRPGSRPGSRWSERWGGLRGKRSTEFDPDSPPPVPQIEAPFSGIALDIPTPSLEGLGPQSMRFSKRGSLINEEERKQVQREIQEQRRRKMQERPSEEIPCTEAVSAEQPPATDPASVEADDDSEVEITEMPRRRVKPASLLRVRQSAISSRTISADEDMLSRRVRLMYEKGEENVTDMEVAKSMALENGVLWEEAGATSTETSRLSGPSLSGAESKSMVSLVGPDNQSPIKREAHELAGGIEYWQDIKAGDVDRYGFIRSPTANSNNGTEPNPIQRVSTSLLQASETPRRKLPIRPPSALTSSRSLSSRTPSRKISEPSIRPSSSQSMYSAPLRRSTSRFRQATNFLPHNRDRRFKDEAGDMLTFPTDTTPKSKAETAAIRAAKKKEWEREDKWTKMARPTKKTAHGGGMSFEFDTQSSKLIERTWKGIPDRWRATAWYSFLEASARRHSDSPTEEDLVEAYNDYQLISSPDDVQIDIDVPRTITSHIMFRRRYRGGQRLLFRVLHAMSLYFPDTGYVQGMAALAATLLAYYDEEHAFIMLVRLWHLRGLEHLYRSGFTGLMEALGDFEREWLGKGEVAAKLNELGIPPTAYGTRWYLTLFNYSIPFPAQLRVWDVFMLLGDADERSIIGAPGNGAKTETNSASAFGKGLDVLHASSAALIDGMREIILDSDFENAMKVLTSWVPIKDVELFMRVAKAEWKVHRRKKTAQG
ncbi:hypothetical protein EYZ11_010498 [Aspergillus tanneri]|uniref:Rab-GAP TBC domain-containing protein n=1 Tax=Aspergillus tanneri TaxID=1220188 RepID=A0A4S3JAK8_9EURO|nr:uncharacterized protein ATNIH1004_007798 [Aspergillus tanneri]KAA8646368.1 hypothetical protein ATNIH1004_007798 [Aspergillus tanneri]THC90041.1 hypothetical protein EYZ11_010498 [Aspergillus tanneri]